MKPKQLHHRWMLPRLAFLLLALATVVIFPTGVRAQCLLSAPGGVGPGTDRSVYCSAVWDPDGSGPNDPVLVVGGNFGIAGNTPTSNIAAWNGASWIALGSGVAGGGQYGTFVYCLAVNRVNELVVGGDFTRAGGATANNIAKWNGTTWTRLGSGFDAPVRSVDVDENGDIFAGGDFNRSGPLALSHIAQWSNGNWTPLGSGVNGASTSVGAVSCQSGSIFIAGTFSSVGGVAAPAGLARWNGSQWAGFSAPVGVRTFRRDAGGDVLAGGNTVDRWNGSAWTRIGNIGASALAFDDDGAILAASSSLFGGPSRVYRWNGTAWQPLGGSFEGSRLFALDWYNGAPFVAGEANRAPSNVVINGIARWSGTQWTGLDTGGRGTNAQVLRLAPLSSGGFLASGTFDAAGTVPLDQYWGRWSGTSWSSIAGSVGASGAMLEASTGNIYVGDGGSVNRRVGSRWTTIADTNYQSVHSLVELPNGDIVVAGSFSELNGLPFQKIARWNGVNWNSLGSGLQDGPSHLDPYSLVVSPAGDLYAGGDISIPNVSGNRVVRWTGSQWVAVGGEINGGIDQLVWQSNGRLAAVGQYVVGGPGSGGSHVAEFDGTAWRLIGGGVNSFVHCATIDGNGDLIIGGQFTRAGNVPANRLARWSGGLWSEFAGGTDANVWTLATLANGSVVVGGDFNRIGGAIAAHWAIVPNNFRRWINPNGGSWHTASDWSGSVVPGPNDQVRFDLDASYNVSITQPASAASVQFSRGDVSLSMTSVAQLTVPCGTTVEEAATLRGTANLEPIPKPFFGGRVC